MTKPEGFDDLTLATVANGAAPDVFARELRDVLENVLDFSTEATKKRQIVLTFVVEPAEDRETAVITIAGSSKLAPRCGETGAVFVGRLPSGEPGALVRDAETGPLFNQDEETEGPTKALEGGKGDA